MTFTAEFRQTETTVGWSWTLRNDDDERVLVFAGPDTERVSADDPPPTWVLGAKGNTVELAQRLLATPKNVDFAWPYGVAAQILEPGEELTGTAEASLPLTTTLPWGAGDDPSQEVPEHPREVYLCVGVGTPEGFRYSLTVGNDPYEIHGEGTAAKQHQFCTETEPLR